jgi:hypothetical protein
LLIVLLYKQIIESCCAEEILLQATNPSTPSYLQALSLRLASLSFMSLHLTIQQALYLHVLLSSPAQLLLMPARSLKHQNTNCIVKIFSYPDDEILQSVGSQG